MTCGAFTPGAGKAVVTGSSDGSVRVWNAKTGACTHTFAGHGWHEDPVNAIACHKEVGAAAAQADGGVGDIGPVAARCRQHTTRPLNATPQPCASPTALPPQKPLLLTASQDGTVRLTSLATLKVLATLRHTRVVGAGVVDAGEEDDDTGTSVEWCV